MEPTVVKRRPQRPLKKKPRRSARDIAEHADQILREMARREQDYARLGLVTATISREELIRSLSGKTAHSPFLVSIGRSNAVRGATFLINFELMQPDPFGYDESNLALCYCWSDAGGLMDVGATLLNAEPSVGVIQVPIGYVNYAPMPYSLSSTHDIPSTFRLGPADLNYFLYMPGAFDSAVLLKRGTLRVVVT
jgi:hypothetical protein